MFLAARSWGVSHSDFWGMTMGEFFLEYEARREKQDGDYAGRLTTGDIEEILADMARAEREN